MKYGIIIILIFSCMSSLSYGFDRKEITVLEVGLSMNTGRIFVKGSPAATETECTDKAHYSIALGSPEAYLFYSAALTAMKEGKKMRIQYGETECVGSGPKIDVYWNLNN